MNENISQKITSAINTLSFAKKGIQALTLAGIVAFIVNASNEPASSNDKIAEEIMKDVLSKYHSSAPITSPRPEKRPDFHSAPTTSVRPRLRPVNINTKIKQGGNAPEKSQRPQPRPKFEQPITKVIKRMLELEKHNLRQKSVAEQILRDVQENMKNHK